MVALRATAGTWIEATKMTLVERFLCLWQNMQLTRGALIENKPGRQAQNKFESYDFNTAPCE